MAKKEQLITGVDIGSHAIKVCQLQKSGNEYNLQAIGSAVVPPGYVEDGVLQEPDQIGKIIAALFSNLKIKSAKIGISISGYSVIVKKVHMEQMSEEELAKHIMEEAEQYIPFDRDDVYLDFQDLKTAVDEEDRTDVMLVAAKKEVVDGYLDMLHKLKLQPVLVDVDGFALENIWEIAHKTDKNVALVDIGASKMNINIIADGASVLARDIVVGSNQLTEQIANALDLEFDEAEKIKIGLMPAEDKQKEIEEIFNATCTNWVFEIKKAIDLYMSNNPNMPLEQLVLSGGGSKIKGLQEYLAKETGLEIIEFNPFATMKINEKKIDPKYLKATAPEMAIATGLAIRPAAF
jgi:type IV pilus assembly protein PilM